MSIQYTPKNKDQASTLALLEDALKKLSYALKTSISITDEKYGILIRPTQLIYYKLLNGELIPIPAKMLDQEIRMDLLMDLGRELLNVARTHNTATSYTN